MEVERECRKRLESYSNFLIIDAWLRRDNVVSHEMYFWHVMSAGVAGDPFPIYYVSNIVFSGRNSACGPCRAAKIGRDISGMVYFRSNAHAAISEA